jgi:hypothetical protein
LVFAGGCRFTPARPVDCARPDSWDEWEANSDAITSSAHSRLLSLAPVTEVIPIGSYDCFADRQAVWRLWVERLHLASLVPSPVAPRSAFERLPARGHRQPSG